MCCFILIDAPSQLDPVYELADALEIIHQLFLNYNCVTTNINYLNSSIQSNIDHSNALQTGVSTNVINLNSSIQSNIDHINAKTSVTTNVINLNSSIQSNIDHNALEAV